MSNPDTPITLAESQGESARRQDSTQPSSPATDAGERDKPTSDEKMDGPEEGEEMDTGSKALETLLKSSEVRSYLAKKETLVFEKRRGKREEQCC